MNYYQHHIGDFIRDTARLSDSQCMAYLRMLWMYYETERPLIDDVDAVAFRIGANASDVHQILRHFFFLHEGMWHNSRCDKEILSFRGKSEKAKKSADARWNNANAMRTQCERNANETVSDANQEPITNNQEPIKAKAPDKPARFDPLQIELPASIKKEVWTEWIAYRRKRKLSTTEQTAKAQIEKLAEWASTGHAPDKIIAESIANGWQGLFEPKTPQRIGAGPTKDPRYHFDTPEYREAISRDAKKYGAHITQEELDRANEEFSVCKSTS